jgi:small-conductance mechanosensitive channel
MNELLEGARGWLEVPLFRLGEGTITLWTLLYLLLLLGGLFFVTSRLRWLLEEHALARRGVERNVRQATGAMFQYVVLFVGMLIIVQTAGLDLTTLNVLAGAVGIGVGFSLQNIVGNFVAGLVILFERPIRLGDRIEVGQVEGDVTRIGARSTTVITNDNIAIIVPNSKFITENVVNWSHTDPKIRFKVPVSVAYGTDARKVEELLVEVARKTSSVLAEPAPSVRLIEFGDNGLLFELRAWTTALLHRRGYFISDLNFAIYDTFRANGIEFPFPQRDIHIRSGRLEARAPEAPGAGGG